MKVTIDGGALHSAVGWAVKLVANQPQMPVLSGLMLDATTEHLRISATDFGVWGTATTSGTVLDHGRHVVSGRLLASITKTLGRDDEVTIATGGSGRVEMRCGRSRWALPALREDDWPVFPEDDQPIGTVAADALSHAIARVVPAVSTEDQPPALAGVSAELGDNGLTLTATDRYRLATTMIGWQPTLGSDTQRAMVLPVELLTLARSACRDSAGEVAIGRYDGLVSIATARHRIVGRLIDGEFPRWRQILEPVAAGIETFAVVNTDKLLHAIEQASVTVTASQPIHLAVGDSDVSVSAPDSDDGGSDVHVEPEQVIGKPITVAVNPNYLRDAIAGVGSREVRIGFTGNARRPILLTPDGEDAEPADAYTHMVMTMKGAAE